MKKIISIFLTLVLCVGLLAALGVAAFAEEEETPIEIVDLSGLNVGEGWGGKKVSEVGSVLASFKTDTMECYEYMLGAKDNSNNYDGMMSDAFFESGKTYALAIWLSAKDGYYFPGTDSDDDKNYAGTTIPANVVQALVFDEMVSFAKPMHVQHGHLLGIMFEFTATEEAPSLGSVLSQGNVWIVAGVAVAAAGAVTALVITKKKKSAASSSNEE